MIVLEGKYPIPQGLSGTPTSFFAWLRVETFEPNGDKNWRFPALIACGHSDWSFGIVRHGSDSTKGDLKFYNYDVGSQQVVNYAYNADTLSANTWYYVGFTHSGTTDEGNLKIYVDGVLEETASIGGTTGQGGSAQNTISIGAMPHEGFDAKTASPSYEIHAYMNDVVVYSRLVDASVVPTCSGFASR